MKNLTKEEREYVMARVQEYFELERDESIGDLAADQLIQYMSEELGQFFYNKGVQDARQMVEQKVINIDEDLLSLVRPAGRKRR